MTPIKVGDLLYLCTPHDIVMALDPVTGKTRWRFDPASPCHGHTAHELPRRLLLRSAAAPGAAPAAPRAPDCSTRIFVATNDARLIALDALSGRPCGDFGAKGQINLTPQYPGYHGGLVSVHIRAADHARARGSRRQHLRQHGRQDAVGRRPRVRCQDRQAGVELRSRQSRQHDADRPLASITACRRPTAGARRRADEKLGLIYLPFGMGAVDQWGGNRPPTTEKFATSIVALDIATGKLRWVFQTVHHDLWDMDVPAQPALVDLPIGGATVPALVQTTKTGNIFVLDRRTGKPIVPVDEKPVPGGPAPGDRLSPTQPFSRLSLMPLDAHSRSRHVGRDHARPADVPHRASQAALRRAVHSAFAAGHDGLSGQFRRDGLGRDGDRPGPRHRLRATRITWRSSTS